MINITNDIAKQRIRVSLIRSMIVLENIFAKQLAPKINGQFIRAAYQVANFNIDIDAAIDETSNQLTEIYVNNYARIGDEFSQIIFNATMQSKGLADDFWRAATVFFQWQAVRRAKLASDTTRKVIKNIIRKGFADGKSNYLIAKDIREKGSISSRVKARTIARTETHSAAAYSMRTSAKLTNMIKEKEWISANDSRVRVKPFNHNITERVNIDDYYQNTGEPLRYPGDFMGSAGNVINCRCMELYHTSPQIIGI